MARDSSDQVVNSSEEFHFRIINHPRSISTPPKAIVISMFVLVIFAVVAFAFVKDEGAGKYVRKLGYVAVAISAFLTVSIFINLWVLTTSVDLEKFVSGTLSDVMAQHQGARHRNRRMTRRVSRRRSA